MEKFDLGQKSSKVDSVLVITIFAQIAKLLSLLLQPCWCTYVRSSKKESLHTFLAEMHF